MIVAIFATSFLSANAQESDGASLPFKGVVDFSMNSSRVSYGLVVRDAPVSVFRARLSDFNVGDSVVPIFVDMTCKNAISSPSRYPEEKFSDTVELNGSTGMEWSRYVKLEGVCSGITGHIHQRTGHPLMPSFWTRDSRRG